MSAHSQSADRHDLIRPNPRQNPAWARQRPELLVFFAVLAVLNFPALFGGCGHSLMFQSDAVAHGQWWRLFTHPFVHVTWYHLLLDGTAFFTLYLSLLETSWVRRLTCVLAGAAGSLAMAWLFSANSVQGLCGLSGIAHGLMAVSAVEMITDKSSDRATRRVGWFSFILVVLKAASEAFTGKMFFAFLDFGMLGNPVAVSHAGGIIGGLLWWMLSSVVKREQISGGQSSKRLPQGTFTEELVPKATPG